MSKQSRYININWQFLMILYHINSKNHFHMLINNKIFIDLYIKFTFPLAKLVYIQFIICLKIKKDRKKKKDIHSSSMLNVCIHPTTPSHLDVTKGYFRRSTADFNSESFSFTIGWLTKAKEHSLSYYLAIANKRIDGFKNISAKGITKSIMKVLNSLADSISYDKNRYIKCASMLNLLDRKLELNCWFYVYLNAYNISFIPINQPSWYFGHKLR